LPLPTILREQRATVDERDAAERVEGANLRPRLSASADYLRNQYDVQVTIPRGPEAPLTATITDQTKVRERSAILAGLAEGTYRAVVTSKVLNEGVDVPDANIAVILSGSSFPPSGACWCCPCC